MLQKIHVGPIHSPVAGRTDHLPMHVPSGSYVIPADIISALGQGNTIAGFKVAKGIFSQPAYGQRQAGGGGPYGMGLPRRADGGVVAALPHPPPVAIVAAGGEYVIHPLDVAHLGGGSLDEGHRVLDDFVKKFRAKTVKTLRGLPGPKKD